VNFTELLRTLIRTYLARADSLQHASILFAEADVPLHLLEEGFGLSGHVVSLVVKLPTDSD